jgi:thioredoxin 2
MSTDPAALSDETLPRYIANTGLPILADFWAPWCAPCRSMAPHFAAAAGQMPDVRFVKVNTDEAPLAAERFGIRSIPTLILFSSGQERARRTGALTSSELTAWVRSHQSERKR